MKAELQGEGTYAYECKEPDCWYCEMMGLRAPFFENVPRKIRQQPEVFIIPMAVVHRREEDLIVPVNSDLTPYQRRKLREMGLPTHRVANYRFSGYR